METTMQQVTLTTPDMSCGHCAARIEAAVGALPGVARVAADPATKRVDVAFDPAQTSIDRIEGVLDATGYPASA